MQKAPGKVCLEFVRPRGGGGEEGVGGEVRKESESAAG